jgi:hypothetical protein
LKKSITLISAALLFAVVGAATEIPKYEVFLGYQYVRSNTFNGRFFNEDLGLFQSINSGFDMHGGDAQFIYNVNNWASFVVDAGGVNRPNIGFSNFPLGVANTTAFVYGGPRFYLRRHHKGVLGLQPFGQILFGAAFRHLSTNVNAVTTIDTPNFPVVTPFGNLFPGPLTLVDAELRRTDNAFSMKVGGGLDYRINKHFGVRALEVNYMLTRFPAIFTGVRSNQNNLAASAGVIFTWGAQ